MTKLRVEGNPLGTGSITLSAPNTNSDITLNLPSSGGAIPTAVTFTATIEGSDGTSDWTQASGSDPWIATVAVVGLKPTDEPVMDIDLSAVAFADVPDVQSDWALVYRGESDTDELTLYATDEPASDFDVILKVVR
jgi:hypothetical protein